ncbi:hypothetical protein FD27_GL000308 [Limosilactobacillus frumenti DSM 13145]|uniref:DUF2252 domain-containing protein n=1 Tax=Limosilactobacillus frumenti DSM 13145 TaxID=1423746 RepID=A0A0R1PCZ4_9LACO|nr:DUF2252 domain-containing protein [Limosilactobacillus frumenti]KRL28034.1 hypothetical protein FD27_GL000308 [Limosilactobacillus frumenti DSM 13145]MBA2913473.1 DUF2252 domain-containing protein [Limosilactobacillus frumenti]QFG73139.1 DUF2252 domain-containing protein [Limosilactobacillus frumenti]
MPSKENLDLFDLKKISINRTKDELKAAGQYRQQKITTADLVAFKPVNRDPVAAIKQTEANMIQELLPLRHQRMLASKFAFFRGTAELMERDLKAQNQSGIPTIICGDAHVNNYGFYASPERQLLFGLNDFDEARIGNWESDLKRLLVSAKLAGEENRFTEDDLDQILHLMTKTYRHAIKRVDKLTLAQRFYSSYEIHDMMKSIDTVDDKHHQMTKILNKIIKKSQHSNSEQITQKMAATDNNGQLRFKDNPPRAKHVSAVKYQQIVAGYNAYRSTVRQDIRVFLANFQISDIIRYSVGVGSFGTRCYLILLTGIDGSHLVLQVKEAMPLRYNLLKLPVEEAIQSSVRAGRRIVTAQKVLQSSSDPFLGSTAFGGRSYYIRQFRDMKESINVAKLDRESFNLYCQICAFLLAIAHYQSPTAPMIRGYLKGQKALDQGLVTWTNEYAKQVAVDFQAFQQAVSSK